MANNSGIGRDRMTWRQCGEALGRLQNSLFLDRDYWVWGNMERRAAHKPAESRTRKSR
ncbi:MAG: hypothetical protein R2826_11355 [Thermoleophilia bacterium]